MIHEWITHSIRPAPSALSRSDADSGAAPPDPTAATHSTLCLRHQSPVGDRPVRAGRAAIAPFRHLDYLRLHAGRWRPDSTREKRHEHRISAISHAGPTSDSVPAQARPPRSCRATARNRPGRMGEPRRGRPVRADRAPPTSRRTRSEPGSAGPGAGAPTGGGRALAPLPQPAVIRVDSAITSLCRAATSPTSILSPIGGSSRTTFTRIRRMRVTSCARAHEALFSS